MKKNCFVILIIICFPFFLLAQNVKISGSISTNYSFPTINDFTNGLIADDFSHLLNADTFEGVFIIGTEESFNEKREMIGKIGFDANANFHFNLYKKLKLRTGISLSYQRTIENIQTLEATYNYTFIDTLTSFNLTIKDKVVNRDIKLWSLSMPINLEHSFFEDRLILFSGINFSAIINQKDTDNDEWVEPFAINPDYRLKLNYFTWKLNLGIEYKLKKNIFLRVNYNHGLKNVFRGEYKPTSSSILYQNRKSHWRSLSLGVTYFLF